MKKINRFHSILLASLFIATSQFSALIAQSAEPNQMSLSNLQNMGTTQTALPNASLENGSYNKQNRTGIMLPGESTASELLPTSEIGLPPPFGANLFAGGYESERIDGLNDDYTIAPGDKVSIWLWGAINQSEVITVDNQGNLFITNVGPVYVANVKASQLNNFVSQKIKQVYKNSVEIYVNLLTTTPVSVYISGSIIRPGQYAGIASDSILYFLKRAGGIDPERGSYRSIKILRQNQVVQEIDLYDFILNGYLPKFNFKDNDVILVERQKATVVVSGSVRNPFRFEFNGKQSNGQQLAKFALPLAKVSHVGIVGDRDDGPFSLYLPYNEFEAFKLRDGDRIIFNDDIRAQVFDIQISGSYLGPSYFAVKKETRLHDLLAQIEIDKNLTDYESIYIQRKSVAIKQKEMIEQSLERLERSVFTAPASSDGEAKIRAEEGKMILEFTQRARKIIPLGKVVISDQGKVFNSNASVEDYIAWAGGYSERANYEQIMLIHPNGMIDLNAKGPLKAGDQILVLPKVDAKVMQSIKDITQIIYQIAIAANVAT
jgi:protein involved in polysaccharide export with SLBB domain/ASC-1-like (ASCH) protein